MEKNFIEEIILPGGTFRRYDDRPDVWIQQMGEGELSVPETLIKMFDEGHCAYKK